jgi:hypothetical protein
MIYELRTYTLKPGTLPEFLRLSAEIGRPIRGDRYGTLVGSWSTELGGLNRYVHLWTYDSLDERERLRTEMGQNPDWQAYTPKTAPLILKQENMILKLHEGVGFHPVAGDGHLYEMRTYQTHTGMVGQWASAIAEAMPTREKYSKVVGLWTTEIGPLNTAVHIWVYDDLNQRASARGAAMQDPDWQAFVAKSSPMLADMQTAILIPTSISPLR